MLDLITKSKVRQKILRLIFANPAKEFYLTEIAKKIGASIGNCQRESTKLVKTGILNSQKRNNLLFYSINKKNPLLKDLRGIINKTIGIEEELKKMIEKIPNVKFAFIFGSYAKNRLSADSDIDLFIIGKIDEDKLIEEIRKTEKAVSREINYHLWEEKEFKLKFERNSFLKNIIKNYILLTNNQNEFKKILG